MLGQLLDAELGSLQAADSLERERLGHDGDGEDAHVLGYLRDHRGRARPRSAAHSCGDEDHVRAVQGIGDLIAGFHRRRASGLGLGPGPQSRRPKLDLVLRLGARQRLRVGIGGNELDAGHSVSDHVIDGVASGAPDPDHLDHGAAC